MMRGCLRPAWPRSHAFRNGALLVAFVGPWIASCGELGFLPIQEKAGLIGVPLGKVAVVTSDYDRVEETLAAFDIDFELYDGFISGPPPDALLIEDYADIPLGVESLLQTPELLETYDVLWINCGVRGSGGVDPETLEASDQLLSDPAVASNLAAFVRNGGRLVVEDWSYGLLEAAFPDALDFYGQDEKSGDAEVGAISRVEAAVVDPGLEKALGVDVLEVAFPVSAWTVVREAGEAEGVWLEADVPIEDGDPSSITAPLVIQQSVGYGTLTFLSIHTQQSTTEVWLDFMVHLLRSLAKE